MSREWLLFFVVLLAGAVPFLRKGLLAVLGLFVLAVVGATQWHGWQQRRERQETAHAKSVPREGRPGGYVTSDTCQSCHPRQYATWHRSYHRTMTQYATPETVRGDFNHVTVQLDGDPYTFTRRGDEFWVEMPDPDARREQATAGAHPVRAVAPPRVSRRVSLLTGSHHMQTCWVPSVRGNMQLSVPFTYLFEDQRWVPRNDTFLLDPEKPPGVQLWNANCIQCHVTGGQPRPDQRDWFLNDTRMAEIGIACEACHGPAEAHVYANQNPLRRYLEHADDEPDDLIVNPARLDHRASTQVCGQCHSIKAIPPGHRWRYDGFSYRPGQDLEQEIPILRAVQHANERWYQDLLRRNPTYLQDRYWPDGMVRVSGREYNGLLETPCYQRGTMSCLSCHSSHESDPNDQLAAGMNSDQACLQCHGAIDAAAHSRHRAGSSGSSCYECHMPHTTYGLLKAIRSHTVDSPNVATTVQTGRPNACNLCHLDQSLEWTARYLQDWYGQEPPALTADDRDFSAAAVVALRGDAGQRALLAWHLGWDTAVQVAGDRWQSRYLAQLLDDPYSTVRYIAYRSLRQQPGFEDFTYDFIAPVGDRARAREEAMARAAQHRGSELRPQVDLPDETWSRLLRARDDRPMNLLE